MAELIDEFISLNQTSKKITVIPEMLDYSFVQDCNDLDELRAIMVALISGEHGKYPHLEDTVRNKLESLLPEKELKKVEAMKSVPSNEDAINIKEGLQGWLSDISSSSSSIGHPTRVDYSSSTYPVRNTAQMMQENSNTKAQSDEKPVRLTRKEKLTTKEYFEEWSKFDPNDYDSDSNEDASTKTSVNQSKVADDKAESIKRSRDDEIFELRIMLGNNELNQAEREFLSNQERVKGNEHFRVRENEAALHCYTKSTLMDPNNAKSFSNQAAVLLRLGRDEGALEACSKAISIDLTYIKALSRRAMIFHKLGRYEEAAEDFKACHSLDPTGGYSRLQEASLKKLKEELDGELMKQTMTRLTIEECDGSDDEIEEVFTPGVLSDDLLPTIDQIKSSTGQTESRGTAIDSNADNLSNAGSEDSWEKINAVEVFRDNQEESLLMRRVEIRDEIEDSDDEAWTRNNDSNQLKEQGNAAMKAGQIEHAIKMYSRALELDSSNAAAYNNRSQAYIALSLFEKAAADSTSCVALEPQNTKALYRRGCCKLMQTGDESAITSAKVDFENALSLNPPKDQKVALSKKLKECQKLLQAINARQPGTNPDTKIESTKPKRSHDSSSLCF
jgi:tetratricopeptide (TPR) repeat protein